MSIYLKDTIAFNGLLETVKALTMVAAGYWIGSSNSSAKKDDLIASHITTSQQKPIPVIPPDKPVI